MIRDALAGDCVVYSHYVYGYTTDASFRDELLKAGGRIVGAGVWSGEVVPLDFVWDDAVIHVIGGVRPGSSANIYFQTTNESFFRRILAIIKAKLTVRAPSSTVFVVVQSREGLAMQDLGDAGQVLVRGNYSAAALSDFDHALDCLKSKSPCGRLVVLNGPPGTGKTFLVRSLLAAGVKAMFVVVPSQLVGELQSPSFQALLLGTKSEHESSVPVVLIVEDADGALLPRGSDNHDAVAALLNSADGIVGRLLDLRIIATTNARVTEVDPALKRPGRLCRMVDVGSLSADQANAVAKREGAEADIFDKPTTLAQAYAGARR